MVKEGLGGSLSRVMLSTKFPRLLLRLAKETLRRRLRKTLDFKEVSSSWLGDRMIGEAILGFMNGGEMKKIGLSSSLLVRMLLDGGDLLNYWVK